MPHDFLTGCADKPPRISVDSHVQVLLACIRPILCFLFPPGDVLPPPGRRHPSHIYGRTSDGGDGDPLRPRGFHSRHLGQRPRGPTMVPHANAHARQARRIEPPSCDHLLVGTHHGSHHGHRQRLPRELERIAWLPLPGRPKRYPKDCWTSHLSGSNRILHGPHRVLVRASPDTGLRRSVSWSLPCVSVLYSA